MRKLLILCSLALAGCTTFDVQRERVRPPAPKPWLLVEVADTDRVRRSLGSQAAGGAHIRGCAQVSSYGCVMLVPFRAPAWLIKHEKRHCDGEDHSVLMPPRTRSTLRT